MKLYIKNPNISPELWFIFMFASTGDPDAKLVVKSIENMLRYAHKSTYVSYSWEVNNFRRLLWKYIEKKIDGQIKPSVYY